MTGRTISGYQITDKLGEGGMDIVYRARDTKLNREVAVKVLPEQFARDRQRMARFEREAHVLASLNHPHIASIHGLEEQRGVRVLVMELVEGPTLADRIAEDAIPLEEALPLAQQMVEAFPFDTAPRYLIRDRDGIYGETFRRRVRNLGVEKVPTAPRSPWQNPYAERLPACCANFRDGQAYLIGLLSAVSLGHHHDAVRRDHETLRVALAIEADALPRRDAHVLVDDAIA